LVLADTPSAIDDSQRKAARAAGFILLLLMATGIFAYSVRSSFLVPGDAAKTAANIMASPVLFRLCSAFDVMTAAGDTAIGVALYVLLKPVNRSLALVAALWRVTDGAILAGATIGTTVVMLFLDGPKYLQAFTTDQLQALARLSIGVYAQGFTVGFVFLSLGALVFSFLLFRSRYIPKAISALGIFAYAVMLVGALAVMTFPHLPGAVTSGYYAPAGVFEITAGLWLLLKGVDTPNWGWLTRSS
jgi:Domain of unknown function (DUF4386)